MDQGFFGKGGADIKSVVQEVKFLGQLNGLRLVWYRWCSMKSVAQTVNVPKLKDKNSTLETNTSLSPEIREN